jgi:Type II secretion system (T2SS), protein E, N-terminal domain
MRLGTMLLRDSRITQAQLDAALAMQPKRGGRLGTILFEMGFIDADSLTVYLGLELGIPIATKAVLDRAKRAAVRLLAPELAERFLCVPLVVQDRQLIAAVRDPHDLLALDELGSATSCRIIPRVAPEVRLYYYVERYYGVPRPPRYRAMGDTPIEVRRGGGDAVEPPPPPLPGLPPPARSPVRAPTPTPPLRLHPEHEHTDELAIVMEADVSEVAEPATPPMKVRGATPPSGSQVPPPPRPETPAALSAEEAIQRMAGAQTRAEVAEGFIGFARGLFDVCALLVVRDDLAFGWKGFGPDLDADRLETLLIPLDAPSIFKSALEEKDLFAGAAPPSALHGHLFKLLRTSAPAQAVVAPILMRDRVVNIMYGQRAGNAILDEASLEQLRKVARETATAYAHLIALQKKQG